MKVNKIIKIINIYNTLCLLILILPSNLYSSSNNNKYEVIVNEIQNKFDCNRNEADRFLRYLTHTLKNIQDFFINVCSTKLPKNEKSQLAENALITIFNKSTIQTSSLYRSNIQKFNADDYFNRFISNYNGKYSKIELLFNLKHLHMKSIRPFFKEKEKYYKIEIELWQIFKAYSNNSNLLYGDATKKNVSFVFMEDKQKKIWKLKVDSISANKPINIEFYESYLKNIKNS